MKSSVATISHKIFKFRHFPNISQFPRILSEAVRQLVRVHGKATNGWHTSTYGWHTNGIRVHLGEIQADANDMRMTNIKPYKVSGAVRS